MDAVRRDYSMQNDTRYKYSFNMSMLMDFYELTMANGYFAKGFQDKIVCFDMFFRRIPDNGGYAIMAGVEQLVEYMKSLCFDEEDIEYLRKKAIFQEEFLDYLKNFRFICDVWAIPEGMPIFPGEPLIKVRGPIIQAQLIETMILLTINHQCLIATKANRICRAAQGRPVSEFGSRRAQGSHGAIMGARAAFIGGCTGTACAMAERDFNIPAVGTMAHSWVQTFDTEYESFEAYADVYPDNSIFLVDTYNVVKSGVPNVIRLAQEKMIPNGHRPRAIRIDSGDITYLSKMARKMLDEAGLSDCMILVSNSLDEYIIRDILVQGACIDSFGVGEKLITSQSEPVFGGVYKLAGIIQPDGSVEPKLKLSENVEKITLPGDKQVMRLFSRKNDKMLADVIVLSGETISEDRPYEIFDPENTWKRKVLYDFYVQSLLQPIFEKGNCVYEPEPLEQIRGRCIRQVGNLWEEVTRFENPQKYFVDLSQDLWDLKYGMLANLAGMTW